jgi:CRISPR-associated protein Cmr4
MSDQYVPFKTKKYLSIAKEPVYVGTGGYRIGRVDNTIVRDPATNLPKIPGSTISGNARYYSWLARFGNGSTEDIDKHLGCSKGKRTKNKDGKIRDACGVCKICITYGFINDDSAHKGLAGFSDARILFFPVSTMIGTVWITSKDIVEEFINIDKSSIGDVSNEKFVASSGLSNLPKDNNGNEILNFGWIMLEKKGSLDIGAWSLKKDGDSEEVSDLQKIFEEIKSRICVVSADVFHHIVNSNLETRTSVSINPITGAAESGALFTFEALPRGTVFIMDVTYENPKNYGKDEDMDIVIETVEEGLKLFSSLGIGGMGTRGFGKIEVKTDIWVSEKEYWEKVKEYIPILKNKIEELANEIEKERDEKKKKELENKKRRYEQKKKLWEDYAEKCLAQKKQDEEKNKEIVEILESIVKSKEDK